MLLAPARQRGAAAGPAAAPALPAPPASAQHAPARPASAPLGGRPVGGRQCAALAGAPLAGAGRAAWRRRGRRRGQRPPRAVACAAAARGGGGAAAEAAAPQRVLLLGGAGRIGTAAATHLAQNAAGDVEIILAGRSGGKGAAAVKEVERELAGASNVRVFFRPLDWSEPGALARLLRELRVSAVLHTAGPFDSDPGARVLEAVIAAQVPVYVDVADPMGYIASARGMDAKAREAGTMALVSAGAFPGFSNVLAVECARRLCPDPAGSGRIRDVDFAYFTAGLGGSGPVNLLITNLGFGEPVPVYADGAYAPQMTAGSASRRVPFFVEAGGPAYELVGERDVWPWPFPEAATVAEHLGITGASSTGMGTAPGIWNAILVALVGLVPRPLWRERWFSEGLAWFSLPLVWVTDLFVRETHAMRVEVTASDGRRCVAVQAHQSFRRCVAQSAAEFALELLDRRQERDDDAAEGGAGGWKPGVWLPEELADDAPRRPRLLRRLTGTAGTVSCDIRVLD